MKEKLREHIEKVVPITNDEFTFIASHFSIKNIKENDFKSITI